MRGPFFLFKVTPVIQVIFFRYRMSNEYRYVQQKGSFLNGCPKMQTLLLLLLLLLVLLLLRQLSSLCPSNGIYRLYYCTSATASGCVAQAAQGGPDFQSSSSRWRGLILQHLHDVDNTALLQLQHCIALCSFVIKNDLWIKFNGYSL